MEERDECRWGELGVQGVVAVVGLGGAALEDEGALAGADVAVTSGEEDMPARVRLESGLGKLCGILTFYQFGAFLVLRRSNYGCDRCPSKQFWCHRPRGRR